MAGDPRRAGGLRLSTDPRTVGSRGPWNHAIDLLEFRGDKVAAESIYVFEGRDAPDWRAQ
jgi:hypothetical protein